MLGMVVLGNDESGAAKGRCKSKSESVRPRDRASTQRRARLAFSRALRQGAEAGRVHDADEVFDELRKRYQGAVDAKGEAGGPPRRE